MNKFDNGNIKVYNGDAIKLMKQMIERGMTVDCIVSDPPYLTTSRGSHGTSSGIFSKKINMQGKVFANNSCDVKDWAPLLYSVLKETGHAYIMTNDKNLQEYLNVLTSVGFKFIKDIIWDKGNKIMGQFYMGCKEHILFFRKGAGVKINNCGTPDILSVLNKKHKREDGTNWHDTEKPVDLMKILIENSSKEGELVMDPFVGVGATPVACLQTKRKFIGAEIDQEEGYWPILVKRLEDTEKELNGTVV